MYSTHTPAMSLFTALMCINSKIVLSKEGVTLMAVAGDLDRVQQD